MPSEVESLSHWLAITGFWAEAEPHICSLLGECSGPQPSPQPVTTAEVSSRRPAGEVQQQRLLVEA